jgi:hypothetical protein
MSPEELDRHFAHGSALRDAVDDDIMETIRKNYEQGQRELGWWGRLMLRKFGGIEKPPFMPWMPDGFYESVPFVVLGGGGVFLLILMVIRECSK